MSKSKYLRILKIIGYILLVIYVVAVAGVLVYSTTLDMLPGKYLVMLGVIMAILGVIFAIMHERIMTSFIASILTLVMILGCAIGAVYIRHTGDMIAEVSSSDFQTDVISVFVMKDDKAEKLEDVKDYQIGQAHSIDTTNTKKAVSKFEKDLGSKLKVNDYKTMFLMLDDLRSGKIGAIVINEAYVGIASDVEGYDWAATELKRVASMEYEVALDTQAEVPADVPETFVMYLSGIDTYGGVSARSRSDVNILAVVNTWSYVKI